MIPGLISHTRPGLSSTSEVSEARGGPSKHRFSEEAVAIMRLPPPHLVRWSCKTTTGLNIQGIHPRLNTAQNETSHGRILRENVDHHVPNYVSSGSDHDPSSVCLFAMVNEFMENEGAASKEHGLLSSCASSSSKESCNGDGSAETAETLQSLALCTDSAEDLLLRNVELIMDSVLLQARPRCSGHETASVTAHGCLKRLVMSRLQKLGYNAAVCKTKWDHSCGIPAGDYEYIDVLLDEGGKPSERVIVDIDFQAQFVIARPSAEFTEIWQLLPQIYVGRPDRLKQIVRLLCEATKQSLHVKGLHLPPWRKPAYMKAKWFSSYKRTCNNIATCPCREGGYCNNGLGFAVRGGALDARYTSELEIFYHDVGAKYDCKDVTPFQRNRDEIRVMLTDWQPPVVGPKPSKQRRVPGLTSLLKQSTCIINS